MNKKLFVVPLVVTLSLYGCGTILKPEQVNKPHSDQLDYRIVLLDGVGLIFFIIPGLVAYAVDYANGTLYLSPADAQSMSDLSEEGIIAAVEQATGERVRPEQIIELSREQAREDGEFLRLFVAQGAPDPASR